MPGTEPPQKDYLYKALITHPNQEGYRLCSMTNTSQWILFLLALHRRYSLPDVPDVLWPLFELWRGQAQNWEQFASLEIMGVDQLPNGERCSVIRLRPKEPDRPIVWLWLSHTKGYRCVRAEAAIPGDRKGRPVVNPLEILEVRRWTKVGNLLFPVEAQSSVYLFQGLVQDWQRGDQAKGLIDRLWWHFGGTKALSQAPDNAPIYTPIKETQVTLRNLRLNPPFIPSDFTVQIPSSTYLYNEITHQISYLGSPEPTPARLFPKKRTSWGWIAVAGFGALFTFTAGYFWYQRRRKR